MSTTSVLVDDDDPIYLEVAKERLVRSGYTVQTRDEAIGTSEWIVEHAPDLVLLDQMMPALSGSMLAQILRKRGVKTAIVLHSSKSADELAELVKATGAIGAIPKSHDAATFTREFDRLAARSARGG